MLSKFIRSTYKSNVGLLLTRKVIPKILNVRYADMIPPTQYDVPFPSRLKFGCIIRERWEIIPLFIATGVALSFMFYSIVYACQNKVDVVFTSRSRENISRTMDLRCPTIHKLIIINQKYPPWPEMQSVLDKMRMAEKRALMRLQTCAHP
ncbi:unnamed protein product [Spodoptera littoralis]|uniref:Uncharacterized protein n=2 Tax=Spodoptera TaxID=7106 RepID=A0A9P0IEF8_SPOLI|nr:uncharacterized protein LOC111351951 [Spodoptera litura]CAB3516464.1 unnamed protein product [Spodoptera littoralis]CAH1646348.1 unnamed protein product [Spodoptera littoralis]